MAPVARPRPSGRPTGRTSSASGAGRTIGLKYVNDATGVHDDETDHLRQPQDHADRHRRIVRLRQPIDVPGGLLARIGRDVPDRRISISKIGTTSRPSGNNSGAWTLGGPFDCHHAGHRRYARDHRRIRRRGSGCIAARVDMGHGYPMCDGMSDARSFVTDHARHGRAALSGPDRRPRRPRKEHRRVGRDVHVLREPALKGHLRISRKACSTDLSHDLSHIPKEDQRRWNQTPQASSICESEPSGGSSTVGAYDASCCRSCVPWDSVGVRVQQQRVEQRPPFAHASAGDRHLHR